MYNFCVKVYNFIKNIDFFYDDFLTSYDSEFDDSLLQISPIFVKFWQRNLYIPQS